MQIVLKEESAIVEQKKADTDVLLVQVGQESTFAYTGPFNSDFGYKLWEATWVPGLKAWQLPSAEVLDPLKLLSDVATQRHRMSEGLPFARLIRPANHRPAAAGHQLDPRARDVTMSPCQFGIWVDRSPMPPRSSLTLCLDLSTSWRCQRRAPL